MISLTERINAGIRTEERLCDIHGPYEDTFIGLIQKWRGCPKCNQDLSTATQQVPKTSHCHVPHGGEEAGILRRYQKSSLDTFQAESSEQQKILQRLKRYVENSAKIKDAGVWALLAGGCGTGKTHCLSGLTSALISRGYSASLVRASDLLDRLQRERFDRQIMDRNRFDAIIRPDFLLIDEVLPDTSASQLFFDALDARYMRQKPTVLAGNAAVLRSTDEAVAKGLLGDRLADRFFEGGGQILRFTWSSWRVRSQGDAMF